MERRNRSRSRVIEDDRADADTHVELEAMSIAEKWLILADGIALVVEDRPAAAHPARIDYLPPFDDRPRLGLYLLLNLMSEAIRVREGMLNFSLLSLPQIGVVSFTEQRIDHV